MTDHSNDMNVQEPDPADSKADTIAIFCLLVIAISAALFFVSQG